LQLRVAAAIAVGGVIAALTIAVSTAQATSPSERGCGTTYGYSGAAYKVVVVIGQIQCRNARSVMRPTNATGLRPHGWQCAAGLATRPELPLSAGTTCTRGKGRDHTVVERIAQPAPPAQVPRCTPGDLGC
jgi:hypothetical protein